MLKKILIGLLLAATQMQAVIDINGKGVNKQALFIGACSTGNHELAKLLIEAGVNVNYETDDGMTLLMKAAQRNDIEMVKLLIIAGANVNTICKSVGNRVALDFTVNTEIIKFLINAGANVNNIFSIEEQYTSLSIKIAQKNIDNIKLLINAGAHINVKLSHGLTVLQQGLIKSGLFNSSNSSILTIENEKYIELLINIGLDFNAPLDKYNNTLLHLCSRSLRGGIKTVKLLLSSGLTHKTS
jgi:ankyrin repeat protein